MSCKQHTISKSNRYAYRIKIAVTNFLRFFPIFIIVYNRNSICKIIPDAQYSRDSSYREIRSLRCVDSMVLALNQDFYIRILRVSIRDFFEIQQPHGKGGRLRNVRSLFEPDDYELAIQIRRSHVRVSYYQQALSNPRTRLLFVVPLADDVSVKVRLASGFNELRACEWHPRFHPQRFERQRNVWFTEFV